MRKVANVDKSVVSVDKEVRVVDKHIASVDKGVRVVDKRFLNEEFANKSG